MAQVTQQLCDSCGKTLSGKNGRLSVYEPFIQIKGQMGIGVVDKETKWRDFFYVSPHSTADLSFCGFLCLESYFKMRLEMAQERKVKRLREEAAQEQNDRLAGDGGVTIGGKLYRPY